MCCVRTLTLLDGPWRWGHYSCVLATASWYSKPEVLQVYLTTSAHRVRQGAAQLVNVSAYRPLSASVTRSFASVTRSFAARRWSLCRCALRCLATATISRASAITDEIISSRWSTQPCCPLSWTAEQASRAAQANLHSLQKHSKRQCTVKSAKTANSKQKIRRQ